MWTEESYDRLLAQYLPIDTGGSMNQHVVTCTYKDDGDTYYCLHIPVWSNNPHVVQGALDLVNGAFQMSSERTQLYVRENMFVLHLFISVCDPD